ncbi:cytochrome P450 [Calothrix sp. PCC 7716]|nr:cytochrome P450 [Calothrix sp. PCC 7716]
MSKDLLTLPHPDERTVMEGYSQNPLDFFKNCAREFGEIVPVQLEDDLICLLTNPEHITEVLKNRVLFVKGKDLQILHRFLGNGLITSEGDFWQRQRRLTQPVFHQQRIEDYGAVMVEYTARILQTWREDEVRDVYNDMMRLTFNIVMKTLFDQDMTDNEANQILYSVEEAMNWYETQSVTNYADQGELTPADIRYQSAMEQLDQAMYAMIQQRREQGEMKRDLLSMLMQVQDADDGSKMSDLQLRDEAASLITAGHETTSNTLSWTWMLLAQHPQVREKLTQELKTVLDGRLPTLEDLPSLVYTTMIIKESMRLYPAVTDLSREATQDCEIGGYFIPKGCTLIMSQWVMHRDPRYFEDPEVFIPERWENDIEKQIPRGVYFPFGDGPRFCIGKSFAMMEAVLILATIAQKWKLELAPDCKIELQPSITLRPKHGIKVILKQV